MQHYLEWSGIAFMVAALGACVYVVTADLIGRALDKWEPLTIHDGEIVEAGDDQ